MGIAEAYRQYVDADLVIDDEEVGRWAEEGLDEWVEQRVASLVVRWSLMNVYVKGGMERLETARLARQVARNSCSWLMHVAGMEAYDWTYKDSGSLMPEEGTEEYRRLAHTAASLDLSGWLARWREDTLARLTYFCSVSERSLGVVKGKTLQRRLNKLINAIQKELDGVIHAIQTDNSKPKKGRRKDTSVEEPE